MVDFSATLFNCTPVDRASDYDGPDLKLFILDGLDWSSFECCLVHRDSTDGVPLLEICSGVVEKTLPVQGSPAVT